MCPVVEYSNSTCATGPVIQAWRFAASGGATPQREPRRSCRPLEPIGADAWESARAVLTERYPAWELREAHDALDAQ